ncbi:MAG: hypothetical protein WC768_02685 [Patescibacteria group bacterium]|jgi:hypothetical protein
MGQAIAIPDEKRGTIQLGQPISVVKFITRFSNRNAVPKGIDWRPRGSDTEEDTLQAKKAIEAGQPELAKVGGVREGRVDTGKEIIKVCGANQVTVMRKALANNAYVLVECYAQEREKFDKRRGTNVVYYLVCLVYKHTSAMTADDVSVILTNALVEGIRDLCRRTWTWVNVWANLKVPVLPEITINVSGGQPGKTPNNALVIWNHVLQVIPVTAEVTEAQE